MKVLTTEQIREADQYTITHEPIRSADLMERAANALTAWLLNRFHATHPFRIFAGYGNNGGDGIAMARLLADNGRRVHLHVLNTGKGFSPDAQENLNRLNRSALSEFTFIRSSEDLPDVAGDEIIVDALFGSGLTREPDGLAADIIDHVNSHKAKVVAVDIPSGLFGEDNRANSKQHVLHADITLTLQVPRLCMFFPENHAFTGEWHVVPIGLHHEYITRVPSDVHYITGADCRSWLRSRETFDHKGT
jgi:NAD(P)H-hydrate epimerase